MGITLVCGDDEDWRIVDLSENVRDLVRITIESPDHPHAATRRHLCQHPEGSILALLKAVIRRAKTGHSSADRA